MLNQRVEVGYYVRIGSNNFIKLGNRIMNCDYVAKYTKVLARIAGITVNTNLQKSFDNRLNIERSVRIASSNFNGFGVMLLSGVRLDTGRKIGFGTVVCGEITLRIVKNQREYISQACA